MNGILENDINIFGLYKKIITKKNTHGNSDQTEYKGFEIHLSHYAFTI